MAKLTADERDTFVAPFYAALDTMHDLSHIYIERNILGNFRCYLPEAQEDYAEKLAYARVTRRAEGGPHRVKGASLGRDPARDIGGAEGAVDEIRTSRDRS
jgi:hypothetical protein